METELRHALSTAERAVAEVEEQLAAQERAHEEQSGVQQQLMHQAYASTQARRPTLCMRPAICGVSVVCAGAWRGCLSNAWLYANHATIPLRHHAITSSWQALERGLEEQRDAAAAEAARHAAQLASVEAGALLSHPYS